MTSKLIHGSVKKTTRLDAFKQALISGIVIAIGVILMSGQAQYHWFVWANVWSGRIWIGSMFAIISLGPIFLVQGMRQKILTWFILFVVLNVLMLAFGGYAMVQDAINSTTMTTGPGIYFAFDGLSALYTDTATQFAVIMNTLEAAIPGLVFVYCIILVIMPGDEEPTQAIIKIATILVVMLAFGFLGKTIGFNVFGNGLYSYY
jgi:hypothetical protein